MHVYWTAPQVEALYTTSGRLVYESDKWASLQALPDLYVALGAKCSARLTASLVQWECAGGLECSCWDPHGDVFTLLIRPLRARANTRAVRRIGSRHRVMCLVFLKLRSTRRCGTGDEAVSRYLAEILRICYFGRSRDAGDAARTNSALLLSALIW